MIQVTKSVTKSSTSDYCVLIEGNLISWKNRKHTVAVVVSSNTKCGAMAHTICELLWLKYLLQQTKFCEIGPIKLVCDNQSALYLINLVFHERSNRN